MKELKKIFAVCFSMVMILTLCVGCGSSDAPAPEASMEAFCQLLIKHDVQSMKELGINTKDAKETLDAYESETKSSLKKSFQSADVSVTNADINKVYTAIDEAMKNLEYTVSVTKSDDKQATIKVETQTLDYINIIKKAKSTTVDSLKSEHIETKEDAKNLFITNICKGFENYKPNDEKQSKSFVFTKQNVKTGSDKVALYFPESASKFGNELIRFVINQ